jgi:hypothetical protein
VITKFEAFRSLCPDCGFGIHEDGTVDWFERNKQPMPSDAEIEAEIARLEAQYVIDQQAAADAKQSALNKLAAIGLTPDEIKQLLGV